MNCKTIIIIPTYNERDNAPEMCRQLLELGLDVQITFMDDNSPDGTGKLLDELAAKHPGVSVIHRPGKLGIGSAHQDAIKYAYDQGYETLITMDCDFTHLPADIPRLLNHPGGSDLTIGSRYMQKDSLPGWNLLRRFLTNFGHFLTRTVLGIRYDATGAFRVYRLKQIPRHVFDLVSSRGYAFFFESMFILDRNGVSIAEIPIVLPARTYGSSKMSWREASRSGFQVFSLWAAEFSNPGQFRVEEPISDLNPSLRDPQGWDEYWNRKSHASGMVYEVIAAVYRRAVIRRRLNSAIRKSFPKGNDLLHAGCGSGQVDTTIQSQMRITALDISAPALRLYRRNNPDVAELKHASILELPFADATFDGVYNLGVMEHFHEPEIQKIFSEIRRVLKPGGRFVIFWPHAHASSVMVLGLAHWIMNRVLKMQVQLHPAEVSLMKSRRQAESFCRSAGLELVRYSFGPLDGFVQSVIVASKPADAPAAPVEPRQHAPAAV